MNKAEDKKCNFLFVSWVCINLYLLFTGAVLQLSVLQQREEILKPIMLNEYVPVFGHSEDDAQDSCCTEDPEPTKSTFKLLMFTDTHFFFTICFYRNISDTSEENITLNNKCLTHRS